MSKVKITTSLGDIVVRLYDDTPLHRDNFIKLSTEGYYDGCLMHRVIRDFMIQGGDPESKKAEPGAQYGTGGPGYTIEAEIIPSLIHKRGALAAARQGDEVNPERRSSGSQFYIVWGQVYNQGQLGQLAKQMDMQVQQGIFNRLVSEHRDQIMQLRRDRNRDGLMALQSELEAKVREEFQSMPNKGLSDAQKEAYTTVGGTPHLDGQYTVFGEVEEGLDVVEKIQSVKTLRGDRPCEDVKILKTEVC